MADGHCLVVQRVKVDRDAERGADLVLATVPPADIPAIEDLLLRVARLVEEVPEIAELDLNPVIALPPERGCQIVDARIRVEL